MKKKALFILTLRLNGSLKHYLSLFRKSSPQALSQLLINCMTCRLLEPMICPELFLSILLFALSSQTVSLCLEAQIESYFKLKMA